MAADAAELMHRRKCANRGVILDGHVPSQGSAIGENGVVAHNAIVSNMGRSHNEVIASYARHASALDGSPAHRNALAKDIPVADFQPSALPRVLQILGLAANSAKRMEHVTASQSGRAVYDSMRVQNATIAEMNVFADNCVGSDNDSSSQSSSWRNDRTWINFDHGRGSIRRFAHFSVPGYTRGLNCRGSFYRIAVNHFAHQRRLCREHSIDASPPAQFAKIGAPRNYVHLKPQLISRDHRPAKARIIDRDEVEQFILSLRNLFQKQ
jgi:hypothetical protein